MIIRKSWASIVEVFRILFFNPDSLLMGERIRAAIKVMGTSASVLVGSTVTGLIQTSIGNIPVLGNIISAFCGSFVTGIMIVSLFTLIDRSNIVNGLVNYINDLDKTMDSAIDYYKKQADFFRDYAAKLMKIDIEEFEKEVNNIYKISEAISMSEDETELNWVLKEAYKMMDINIPWGDSSFDSFMLDSNTILRFE